MNVSIALCTFNGGRFLREQLASYAAQGLMPHELIVCDDGSTDDTLAIVHAFADAAPFPVRLVVNASRLGVAANFGQAIAMCTGDIIALSDQDDIWAPKKLRRMADAFARDPSVGLVFTDAEAVDSEGASLGYHLWDAVRFTRGERSAARRGRLIDVLLRHYVVTGATLAFRARFRDLVLPIPSHCLHDAWIGLLVTAASKGVMIEEPLIDYRQHATQTSGGERILSFFDQIKRGKMESDVSLETTAARYRSMRERLSGSTCASECKSTIAALDQKVAHLSARARMRRPGTWRLPIILRELSAARYFLFSHPWKSVAADLFL
jgi:hypothetical protein